MILSEVLPLQMYSKLYNLVHLNSMCTNIIHLLTQKIKNLTNSIIKNLKTIIL
jgi:hypothetical protein